MKPALVALAASMVLCTHAPSAAAQDLVWYHQPKLKASDAEAWDRFGRSVSAWEDTAVIGTHRADSSTVGKAYVFERSGVDWSEVALLTASDAHGADQFGHVVAVAGDTVLTGAFGHDHSGTTSAGAAYVFGRAGSAWIQQAKLTVSGGPDYHYLGSGVALDADTALVGAPGDNNAGGASAGAAFVFVRTGTTWSQEARLIAAGGVPFDRIGGVLAISGETALVGAPETDLASGNSAGACYVFQRSGTIWQQQVRLSASDGAAEDKFGSAVSLAGDTALVGAIAHEVSGGYIGDGAAYVFTRTGTTWSEEAKLTANGWSGGLGNAVHLVGDRALIGALYTRYNSGAAYIFERSGTLWTETAALEASDPDPYHYFGIAGALAGDTALLASHVDDEGPPYNTGTVYPIVTGPAPASYCTAKLNSLGCSPTLSSAGAPSASSTAAFRVAGKDLLPQAAALYFYSPRKADVDFHGGKLCVRVPFRRWLPAKATTAIGGPPCTGKLERNFNLRIQSGSDPILTAGNKISLQLWYRDAADPAGFGDGLTDALRITILP